ncbi:MAG: 3-oxoacid CoA-transferase subunit B, partial [Alphaproteobacteria bacterium]|nr:3-oxoacid CoA-transferase subunit B [Alphaproteobacteria bacterium]
MTELTKEQMQEIIARRVAKEFHNNDVVTLGIGLPTKAIQYLPDDVKIIVQSENGVLGVGAYQDENTRDEHIINAGGFGVTINPGGCFVDSLMSFAMMRGGHIDITVLGALQVDSEGNLANWCIPGKFTPGMGGAMDLVVGTKKLIIAMEHTAKDKPKILKKCTLPLTVANKVNMIITEKGVFEIKDKKLILKEISEYSSIEDIRATTEADFEV